MKIFVANFKREFKKKMFLKILLFICCLPPLGLGANDATARGFRLCLDHTARGDEIFPFVKRLWQSLATSITANRISFLCFFFNLTQMNDDLSFYFFCSISEKFTIFLKMKLFLNNKINFIQSRNLIKNFEVKN